MDNSMVHWAPLDLSARGTTNDSLGRPYWASALPPALSSMSPSLSDHGTPTTQTAGHQQRPQLFHALLERAQVRDEAAVCLTSYLTEVCADTPPLTEKQERRGDLETLN